MPLINGVSDRRFLLLIVYGNIGAEGAKGPAFGPGDRF
jgi:hypothetical protein